MEDVVCTYAAWRYRVMDGESREDEKAEQTNLFPVHSLVPRFENGLG